MEQQALQILKYLAQQEKSRIHDSDVCRTLFLRGFIVKPDPLSDEWMLTQYGKGILQQINKAGTEAMLEMIGKYL